MNFSQALEALKEGNMIKRKEWNGYWSIETYTIQKKVNHSIHSKMIVATFKGNTLPVSPTQEEVLAEDWEIVK